MSIFLLIWAVSGVLLEHLLFLDASHVTGSKKLVYYAILAPVLAVRWAKIPFSKLVNGIALAQVSTVIAWFKS